MLKAIDPAYFTGFQTVYVWQEPDAPELPGQVSERLPEVEVKAMITPEGIKDISDAHCRGLNVPELVALKKSEAVLIDLERIAIQAEASADANHPIIYSRFLYKGLQNRVENLFVLAIFQRMKSAMWLIRLKNLRKGSQLRKRYATGF